MKLSGLILLGSAQAKGKGPGGFSLTQAKQTCSDEPCQNGGQCLPSEQYNRGFFCRCSEGFTGIYCNIKHPTVTCGEGSMEVRLDKQMITEHGLDDLAENVGFRAQGKI